MASEKQNSEERELEEAFLRATFVSEPVETFTGYQGYTTKKKAAKAAKKTKASKAASSRKPSGGSGRKKSGIIIACCAVLLVALIAGGAVIFLQRGPSVSDHVPAGVSVNGIDLSEKTVEEAKALLEQELVPQYVRDMVIALPEEERIITPEESGIAVDVNAIVADACSGRLELNAADYLSMDTDAIQSLINEFCALHTTDLVQPSYSVTDAAPSDDDPDHPARILVLTMGQEGLGLNPASLYTAVLDAYRQGIFRLEPKIETIQPDTLDLQAIYEEFYSEPADASYALVDGECVVQPEHYGCQFDLEGAQALVDGAAYGEVLEVELTYTAPEVLGETLEAMLFRDTLGSCDARHSSITNRDINLSLAAQALDGTIIMPGEVFSYNEVLGQRTTEKGYKPATAYSGGEIVQSIGGGICQGATAVYYSALLADFEIVERKNHTYDVSYVPLGMDATISWGTQDFKFRNNTDYPIKIEASSNKGNFTVRILGTDTKDYYIKMENEIISKTDPEIKYQVMDYNNSNGYQDGKVLSNGHYGYQVKTYKCKYSKADNSLISRTYEASSTYKSYPKTVVQIDPATIPTEPISTEPAPTEPDPTEPTPTEPDPTEPTPTDPSPTEPEPSTEPSEPTETSPEPTDSQPNP